MKSYLKSRIFGRSSVRQPDASGAKFDLTANRCCLVALSVAVFASPLHAAVDMGDCAVVTKPQQNWQYGFLTGNGNLGVIMEGNPYTEKLAITGKFYLPMGSKEIVPDLSAFKDEFKQAGLAAGVNGPAKVHQLMLEKSHQVLVNTDPLHPVGLLDISMPGKPDDAKDYRMTEDFSTGELKVQWKDDQGDWSRRVFVSRPDDAVVMEITGPKDKVTCNLGLLIDHPLVKSETETKPGWSTAHNTYLRGKGGYDVVMRVVPTGGNLEVKDGQMLITNANRILVILKAKTWRTPLPKDQSDAWITSPKNPIYGPQNKTNLLADLRANIAKMPTDYNALFSPHAKAHGALYHRVSLDLGGGEERQQTSEELLARAAKEGTMSRALAERLYNACRYLIICSTGDTPPNLQGVWTGTWSPAWSGDYTLDQNLQLEVQSILSCNMPELMMPYFDLIDSWVPDWRTNAKKLYGFRGAVSNARASTTCLMLHWGGEWPGEQAGIALAGWLLHFYYDYYQFTGDRKFLAKRFLPLAKEIALFYEDFLQGTEGPDGKYRFYMGYSPEHGFSANTTFDIASAKNTFITLISASETLGVEKNNLKKWKTILSKIPPYLVNGNGELQEWSWPGAGEDYNQRHHAHLLPFYQYCEFNRESDPVLWNASVKAFDQKTTHWLHNQDSSNSDHITHGMMNQGQIAARAGRGDIVYEVLSRMTTKRYVFPGFMMSYWPGLNGYGFDPVGTIPDIYNNAFIFGWKDQLDLLPALPKEWPQGTVRGLLLREQIKLNHLTWDTTTGKIDLALTSDKDQTVTLALPPHVRALEATAAGAKITKDSKRPYAFQLILKAGKEAKINLSFSADDLNRPKSN